MQVKSHILAQQQNNKRTQQFLILNFQFTSFMRVLYEFVLILSEFFIKIVAFFNKKAKLWIDGRKFIFKEIAETLQDDKFRIWIHVASLGEFEQGRPLMELLKKEHQNYKIVLTFFSPSGFEIQKNYEFADYVFYLPLDRRRNAEKFIKLINPNFAIFIKYEFWYNHLRELKNRNIPIYLISGIFVPNHAFFKWYGGWYKQILYFFTHFFVQNNQSKQLLENIGIKNVTIADDTRFDRVFDIASGAKNIPVVKEFCNDDITMIFGSSWKNDEELFFEFINKNEYNLKFIIAPHEIHDANIKRILSKITIETVRFSQSANINIKNAQVLIIDNIGMLSSVYQYGNIAYIGGGFGSGIHNILEAATFGLPVIFGPNYHKFQEAIDLIELKGAFVVTNKSEATEILTKLIENKTLCRESSKICSNYIENKRGASKFILNSLEKMILTKK